MADTMDARVFSMMQEGVPLKSYIKTILGKVYVTVLNPENNTPEGLILEGDPRKSEEGCIIDIWSEKEDVFFKRSKNNKSHLELGILIEYKRQGPREPTEEEKANTLPDEEIINLLNSKFFILQSSVNKTTSEATLFRFLSIARDLDKSEKIIKFLEGRLASIQMGE